MNRIILCILCVLLLLGCQPTPTDPIVIQKDGTLEKAIMESPHPYYSYDSPVFVRDIKQLSSKTKLTFEAKVCIEEGLLFPVYRCKPVPFSSSVINDIIPKLFGSENVVEKAQIRSKSVIEQEVSYWMELKNKTMAGEQDGDLEVYDRMIDQLQREWNTAPDDTECMAYNGEWNGQNLHLKSNSTAKELTVWNNETQSSSRLYFTDGIDYYATGILFEQANASSLTPEDAMDMAEQWIQQIEPLKNCHARYIKKGRRYQDDQEDGYVVYFERSYSGLSKAYLSNYQSIGGDLFSIQDIPDFSHIFYNEKVQVSLNAEGITSLIWENPTDVFSLNSNASLLPFDQVLKQIEVGLKSKFAWTDQKSDERKVDSLNILVEEIRLCLLVVPERNNIDEYLLVPAWVCFGEEQDYYGNDIEKTLFKDQSLIGINAIDGTIIC